MSDILLEVSHLKTYFFLDEGVSQAVDGMDFSHPQGQDPGHDRRVRLRQERLRPLHPAADPGCRPARSSAARSSSRGRTCCTKSKEEIKKIRGNDIAMIFQEPMTSLNPVFTIGDQIMEAIRLHQGLGQGRAPGRWPIEMLDLVGIPDPGQARR